MWVQIRNNMQISLKSCLFMHRTPSKVVVPNVNETVRPPASLHGRGLDRNHTDSWTCYLHLLIYLQATPNRMEANFVQTDKQTDEMSVLYTKSNWWTHECGQTERRIRRFTYRFSPIKNTHLWPNRHGLKILHNCYTGSHALPLFHSIVVFSIIQDLTSTAL